MKPNAQERIKFEDPKQILLENSQLMSGGFEFLASVLPGLENLDPNRYDLYREEFKANNKYKEEREDLKSLLEIALSAIESSEDVSEMVSSLKQKSSEAEATYNQNLLKALNETAELESTYRSIDLFFRNSGEEKIDNVTFINASEKQLSGDDDSFLNAVTSELNKFYNRRFQDDTYSLLIVPGFLGQKGINDLARVAERYKVLLITDYENVDSYEKLIKGAANLQDLAPELANVALTGNWLVLRKPDTTIGETKPVFGPPSLQVGSGIYRSLVSQPAAGDLHGKINGVYGTRIELMDSEWKEIDKLGLIPMTYEQNKVVAMSDRTLHKSADKGMMTYSVVRVFDLLDKTLKTYLNNSLFQSITPDMLTGMKMQLTQFLENWKTDKIIDKFLLKNVSHDGQGKISIDLEITPKFSARTIVVNLSRSKDSTATSTTLN